MKQTAEIDSFQVDVNKVINDQYQYTDKFLNGMARYPILAHKDAVFLIDTLDEVLRNCVIFISQFTTFFVDALEDIVVKFMFSKSSRDIFCSNGDYILPAAFHYLHKSGDMDLVLETVGIYRLYWLLTLSKLRDYVQEYTELSAIDVDSENYVEAQVKIHEIVNKTGINPELMFGVVNEIKYYSQRIQKIQDKLTMPYLRKVAQLAKMRAGGGKFEACLDNYQSGVTGIFQAVGRYDTTLGSYASLVELWVNNRMLIGIRSFGNPVRVPDRAYKHKRLYDHIVKTNPLVSYEDAASEIGVDEKTLIESLHFVDMQGMGQLIDETATDDFGIGNEDYIDNNADSDSVNTVIQEFDHVLNDDDKALLHLLYGCEVEFSDIDTSRLQEEAARHLFLSHFQHIAKHGGKTL